MGELECKVLELIEREYAINYITRELNIKDEYLADIIINLEDKGLITLKDKKWKITEKGKEMFEKRDKLLKKLKVEYLYGEIDSRDEYDKRRKELEDISQIISSTDEIIEDGHEKEYEIAKTEIIHPEIVSSPEIQVPEIQVPEIQVPEIQVPEIQVPEIQVPEIQVVEQKSEDEPLNRHTTGDEPSKDLPKEEPIKKICSKCGVENKPESNYCRKCGTVLKD